MNSAFLTHKLLDEAQTLALGAAIGARLGAGDCVALTGPLGAGKTTFARGLIRAFVGVEIDVPSPTFTLVQIYAQPSQLLNAKSHTLSHAGPPLDLYHFDLYRLKNEDDVWELGWEDIGEAIALVEWPDKAGTNLPANRLDITLSFDGSGRVAQFSARDNDFWKDRLDGA
jgi:tRNA threonylcarbamoyladenosine biosynthesis protein TsaE